MIAPSSQYKHRRVLLFLSTVSKYLSQHLQVPASSWSLSLKVRWETHSILWFSRTPRNNNHRASNPVIKKSWNGASFPQKQLVCLCSKFWRQSVERANEPHSVENSCVFVLSIFWKRIVQEKPFVTLSCQIIVFEEVRTSFLNSDTAHQIITEKPLFGTW